MKISVSVLALCISMCCVLMPCFCAALYNKENTGSVFFPLEVDDVTGFYHYRIMVNYVGQPVHCVYESVPFMVIQDPYKNFAAGGVPYVIKNPSYKYLTKPLEELYQ